MKNRQYGIIIRTAAGLFARKGTKAVLMDEVARRSGISKRTLYQHFSGKESLIQAIIQQLVLKAERHMRIGPRIAPNAISELMYCFRYLQEHLSALTALFLKDLRQYYPITYNRFCQWCSRNLVPYIRQNINRGIAEKLYRKEIDSDQAGRQYYWQLGIVLLDPALPETDRLRFLTLTNDFFLHAIMSVYGSGTIISKA